MPTIRSRSGNRRSRLLLLLTICLATAMAAFTRPGRAENQAWVDEVSDKLIAALHRPASGWDLCRRNVRLIAAIKQWPVGSGEPEVTFRGAWEKNRPFFVKGDCLEISHFNRTLLPGIARMNVDDKTTSTAFGDLVNSTAGKQLPGTAFWQVQEYLLTQAKKHLTGSDKAIPALALMVTENPNMDPNITEPARTPFLHLELAAHERVKALLSGFGRAIQCGSDSEGKPQFFHDTADITRSNGEKYQLNFYWVLVTGTSTPWPPGVSLARMHLVRQPLSQPPPPEHQFPWGAVCAGAGLLMLAAAVAVPVYLLTLGRWKITVKSSGHTRDTAGLDGTYRLSRTGRVTLYALNTNKQPILDRHRAELFINVPGCTDEMKPLLEIRLAPPQYRCRISVAGHGQGVYLSDQKGSDISDEMVPEQGGSFHVGVISNQRATVTVTPTPWSSLERKLLIGCAVSGVLALTLFGIASVQRGQPDHGAVGGFGAAGTAREISERLCQ